MRLKTNALDEEDYVEQKTIVALFHIMVSWIQILDQYWQ